MKLKFGSVCSGIEAASVAWEPLGWRASWFAEIEAFPSAVLAYRFPSTLNLGDMTKIAEMVSMGFVDDPDVLVGGTPCQAFSVAGSRKSLDDERGQLSLSFITLANTIDEQRIGNGKDECIVVWENVPGVLNTKDNAFGCFLGELSGAGCELQPSGKKWTNSGCVCLDPKEQSRGESSMPNISEWHNDADVCLLSQVLEKDSIQPKFYLSPKACAGILRRAETRGKKLPEVLAKALQTQAAQSEHSVQEM